MTDQKFKKTLIISGILIFLALILFAIDFMFVKPKIEQNRANSNSNSNTNTELTPEERL